MKVAAMRNSGGLGAKGVCPTSCTDPRKAEKKLPKLFSGISLSQEFSEQRVLDSEISSMNTKCHE
jgi:hypothetical protein